MAVSLIDVLRGTSRSCPLIVTDGSDIKPIGRGNPPENLMLGRPVVPARN